MRGLRCLHGAFSGLSRVRCNQRRARLCMGALGVQGLQGCPLIAQVTLTRRSAACFCYTSLWLRCGVCACGMKPRVCIVGPCTRGLSAAQSPRRCAAWRQGASP